MIWLWKTDKNIKKEGWFVLFTIFIKFCLIEWWQTHVLVWQMICQKIYKKLSVFKRDFFF